MGGKLGDFIHSMYAVKRICETNNIKANVYMVDFGWEYAIENTFNELKPILLNQKYIKSFSILTDYYLHSDQRPEKNSPIEIFNEKIKSEGYIDLGSYISSPHLYKMCWTEFYSKTFNFDISSDYPWIEFNKIDETFKDKVLIHRRNNPVRINDKFPINQILEEYGDRLVFIASSVSDYENFKFKDKVPFIKIETIENWFLAINSCDMIITNLSAPAVISHSLDKLRIIELPNTADSHHCMGEEKFSSNIFWYLNERLHNL